MTGDDPKRQGAQAHAKHATRQFNCSGERVDTSQDQVSVHLCQHLDTHQIHLNQETSLQSGDFSQEKCSADNQQCCHTQNQQEAVAKTSVPKTPVKRSRCKLRSKASARRYHSHYHDHQHEHSHEHGLMGHDHSQANIELAKNKRNRRKLAVVLTITLGVNIAEIAIAIYSNSMALLADSAHMIADSIGLAFALFIAQLLLKPADAKRTWGYKRAEILGALAQSVLLVVMGVFIVGFGIYRIFNSYHVESHSMGLMGVIGLVANVISMLILLRQRGENMNMNAAFLEVLSDTLGSVGVIVAAFLVYLTGFVYFDTVVSIAIAVFILVRAGSMGRKASNILLEKVPDNIDITQIAEHIKAIPHVKDIHDIHVSTISTGVPIFSAHVVVENECFMGGHSKVILDQVQYCIYNHFEVPIHHVTIQLESPNHIEHEYEPC